MALQKSEEIVNGKRERRGENSGEIDAASDAGLPRELSLAGVSLLN